jgi:peroxiredoxin
VPAETQATHARAVAELKTRRVAESTLRVGAQAPLFELNDQNDKPVSSAKLLTKRHLVICFFRGRWCPFCVGQLETMNLILPQIERAGAALVAISPQTVAQSFFMHDQHQLRFPLLSDAGNRVARQFGLVYRVPEYQQALFRSVFIRLPFTNGEDSWELPIPATYILKREGSVVYASADEDYTERPEPLAILTALGIPQAE